MPAFVAPAAATALASAATPAGTTALSAAPAATSFLQPWMADLLPTGLRSLHNLIAPDRQAQIFTDVLAAQTEFRNMLARRAFGQLTPRDTEEIQQAGEPQVNAVAGNVASRGLGSSPAGAQIVADAQGQVFSQARQEALQTLPAYDNLIAQQARTLMASDNSFNEDLSSIVRLLNAELSEDPEARNDTDFISVVQSLWEMLGSPMPTQQGQL